MPRVQYNDLIDFGYRLLSKLGFAEDDSLYITENAAFTQAGGVQTHGAVLLANIESQCGSSIDPKHRPKVEREQAGMALIDGQGAAGPVCMRLAVELATRKARETGVAVVSVRNTTWIAGLGAYLAPLAREGFFAQLLAQSSKCLDAAPAGGVDACFSTNPMAIAFPTDADPVVADFSTAAMSMGKANTLAKAGRKSNQPVFFTKAGELTDDPKAVIDGGAMLPAGGDFDGHKGYALAFWIEALTAMAGGSCNNPAGEQRQSFTLIVIWGEAFGNMDWVRSEMHRMTARIHATRPRPGVKSVRLPGERLQTQAARSRTEGVDIADSLLATLNAAAERRGVKPLAAEA
ncbi:MAG: Ldh family oxidoreductase [Phycisphaerae bacterium]|nr:Ldh family oxidoreductase [Phycisphaerae bacterium]